MITRAALVAAAAIGLIGCAMAPPVKLTAPFDSAQAQQTLAPGNNTISGSAFLRQRGGGVVTCAGSKVTLIPVSPYATERMMHIYGSNQNGYRSSYGIMGKFEPDYPEFYAATRSVNGDAQGAFEFDSVADGEFYISTAVTWQVGYSPQGGHLMQRVKVSGGETKKVVLSE